MKVLGALASVWASGLIFLFFGVLIMPWGSALIGALHGLLLGLLAWACGQTDLFTALLIPLIGAGWGFAEGALVGSVALGVAGTYRAVIAQLACTRFDDGPVFDECVRGALRAGLVCSLGGAATGGCAMLLWSLHSASGGPFNGRLFEGFGMGYGGGALAGFMMGLFVGALAPQGVDTVKARLRTWWAQPKVPTKLPEEEL